MKNIRLLIISFSDWGRGLPVGLSRPSRSSLFSLISEWLFNVENQHDNSIIKEVLHKVFAVNCVSVRGSQVTWFGIFGGLTVTTFFRKPRKFQLCVFDKLWALAIAHALPHDPVVSPKNSEHILLHSSSETKPVLQQSEHLMKETETPFNELRNHHFKHPKCSSLLHVLPCLFFSSCSSCKAELLLLPSKMCRLHAWPHPGGEPMGYTWQSKSSPRVCASPNSLGVILHIW